MFEDVLKLPFGEDLRQGSQLPILSEGNLFILKLVVW